MLTARTAPSKSRRPGRAPVSRQPIKLSQPRRVLSYGVVLLSIFAFWQANRMEPIAFPYNRLELVTRWNDTAVATAHSSLAVPELEWTNQEERTFGHAWTPTLSVIGRTENHSERVVELVVVGQPAVDGRQRLVSAMDVLIATTEPALTAEERQRILADLSLVDDTTVALPSGSVTTSVATYRVAADPQTGRLGLGAAPLAITR